MITILIQYVISTAVGVSVALFVHWLTRNSTKEAINMSFDKASDLIIRQDFLREAGVFKSAFIKIREIIAIEKSHDFHTFDDLRVEIPNQERAVVRFEMYLPENRIVELRQAWEQYRRPNEEDFSNEYFTKEQLEGVDVPNDKEKQLILERINNILHFTDPDFVFGL